MSARDAEAWYAEGMKSLPRWGDDGDDVDARYAAAVALVTRAAEAGHQPAIKSLADGLGGARGFDWAIELAKRGDVGPLTMALTDGDWPPERGLAVLAEARQGAPWAATAVGEVYCLGMADRDGLIATRDGGWGWLPGAAKPQQEGRAWIQRAVDAGWAPAVLRLGEMLRLEDAPAALTLIQRALAIGDALDDEDRRRAARHVAALLDETDAPMAARLAAHEALAAAGDMEAVAWLAERHHTGDGVPVDVARARALYETAADAGVVDACRELGRMCEEGLGGPVDRARAKVLYERAAELGNDRFARRRLVKAFGEAWYAEGPDDRPPTKKATKKKATTKRAALTKKKGTKKKATTKRAAPTKKKATKKKATKKTPSKKKATKKKATKKKAAPAR